MNFGSYSETPPFTQEFEVNIIPELLKSPQFFIYKVIPECLKIHHRCVDHHNSLGVEYDGTLSYLLPLE